MGHCSFSREATDSFITEANVKMAASAAAAAAAAAATATTATTAAQL